MARIRQRTKELRKMIKRYVQDGLSQEAITAKINESGFTKADGTAYTKNALSWHICQMRKRGTPMRLATSTPRLVDNSKSKLRQGAIDYVVDIVTTPGISEKDMVSLLRKFLLLYPQKSLAPVQP